MLWALKLVRLGVTRGFGAQLRRILAASTKNSFIALFSGAAVTMFLQSSMATTMIISSFAGQSMIATSAALALILGADIGTTLVAQVLAFDISWLAPVLLLAGVILFSLKKVSKAKNIARIIIGLGLVLLSLQMISDASAPLKESETLPLILAPLQQDHILALLVAALITWMAHSSLAIVLMLMTLTSSGALPLPLAMIMVLGANIGGTIAPLLSTLRDSPAAMRVPAGNMLIKCLGVLVTMPLLVYYEPIMAAYSSTPARQIVNFHTAFNLILALTFVPFTPAIARMCTKLFPDRPETDDPSRPKYLNEKEMNTPAIALASASRETLRMADALQDMMQDTIKAFKTNNEILINDIRDKDDIIDKLYDSIKSYLAQLSQEYMSKEDAARFVYILTFATNLEHAGDVIDKNLMPLALKKSRKHGSFSPEGLREIEEIHSKVLDSVRLAQDIFVSGNIDLARRLLQEKEALRRAEIEASSSHIDRLRGGVPETIATTSLHLDIIRDLRRINSYMCTVAYPILEEQGQLRTTRLRPDTPYEKDQKKS